MEAGKVAKWSLEGFADFSEYIATDGELSIYRRFGSLGVRNILYLQAELQVLESQLIALDDYDYSFILSSTKECEKKAVDDASRAWEMFEYQARARDHQQCRKMEIIMKLRLVMKDYSASTSRDIYIFIDDQEEKALLCRSQILALESPNKGTLDAFRN
jgi:hypothetical protein